MYYLTANFKSHVVNGRYALYEEYTIQTQYPSSDEHILYFLERLVYQSKDIKDVYKWAIIANVKISQI